MHILPYESVFVDVGGLVEDNKGEREAENKKTLYICHIFKRVGAR